MNDTGRVRVASFEDLEVFKRAYRLSLDVHRRSLDWPQIEQRALGDQVAEGFEVHCRKYRRRIRPPETIESGVQALSVDGDRFG